MRTKLLWLLAVVVGSALATFTAITTIAVLVWLLGTPDALDNLLICRISPE